jgi:predicted MFS family arabinose efflux permease
MVATRYSVRRLLLAAALLMAATGAAFAVTTAFWPLLLIAFVGTMNPTSGDASIFLPLEQAALAQTAEPRRRTAVFARYSVIGSLAGAVGVLAASAPDFAADWHIGRLGVMQLMFVFYAALGVVTLLLYRPLSPAIETATASSHKPLGQSKRLVYGLAALFGMDSFGTGFLVQSLLALWLYQRFQISVTAAATILFWSGICSAISYLIAVPIAARIGLINTMVFTHLPSNILLALVPFAPDLTIAIALLLARSALSQMDVPTRTSYVMAVVAPEERPAAASVTAVPKTFAWAAGSLISGYLLTLSSFGWPLLIGGVVKGAYDILLLIKFRKVRPPEEQGAETPAAKGAAPEGLSAS